MALPTFEPPDDVAWATPFWEAIGRDALALPRCSACHTWIWYPDDAGPCCEDATFEWVDVATTGTLHTWTRVRRAFLPRGRDDVPYVVGFVELDGVDGLRLVVNLADGATDPTIGQRVRATFVEHAGRRRPVFVAQGSGPP
jgi:hypothetical protein